jgi:hypothetical protein
MAALALLAAEDVEAGWARSALAAAFWLRTPLSCGARPASAPVNGGAFWPLCSRLVNGQPGLLFDGLVYARPSGQAPPPPPFPPPLPPRARWSARAHGAGTSSSDARAHACLQCHSSEAHLIHKDTASNQAPRAQYSLHSRSSDAAHRTRKRRRPQNAGRGGGPVPAHPHAARAPCAGVLDCARRR